ncbi:hypothetical protein QFC21_007244 [Naganishia friedmannii]|uniref:Uncharacterized protein n=1 Tax=Naganishia friedmannii TaxID=89922 RepID=A0ACC2UX99_9TREE|nr:hypothetical protein QFC21_007244 [Naganishia friedmannii]
MHVVTSRNSTPSRSPRHSPSHRPLHTNPVPIPPPHTTDLHHANALRYKHLYGFARSPTSPHEPVSAVSVVQGSATTDGSDAEYVGFVVENPDASGSSTVSDSTTRTRMTDTSSLGADDVRFASSASPTAWLSSSSFASSSSSPSTSGAVVFPLSGAAIQGRTVELESVVSDQVVLIEDVARLNDGDDDLDMDTPSDGVCTPRQETLNNRQLGEQRNTSGLRTIQRAISSTRIPFNLLRTTSSAADVSPDEDEFRCSTCHHAGLCAELVMQGSSFKCGDTMTTTSVAGLRERRGERTLSARAVEKTPWTGSRIRGIVGPVVIGGDDARLKVLEGGVDYMRYNEESSEGKRAVADMEDLGRAMEGTGLASPARQTDFSDFANATPIRSSSSSRNPSRPVLSSTPSGRLQRRSWNNIRVEYSASLLGTDGSQDETSPPTDRSSETTSVESAKEAVTTPSLPPFAHLEPVVGANDTTSVDEASKISATSRSRSRVKHLWTLRDAASGVLGAGDGEEKEDERERFDQDDELYGVDVVERGRRRLR